MSVTVYDDHWNTYPAYKPATAPAIVIHALKENKRPIGYAPWPEQPKPKRTRKPKADA